MKAEIYANFTLTGLDLDPDKVTAVVGIIPSKTWRIGDLVDERAAVRYKKNGWRLKSDLPATDDFEKHVTSVLERLQSGWWPLVELCSRYSAELDCVVYSYGGGRPAIIFGRDIVKRAAELHAEISVDLLVVD